MPVWLEIAFWLSLVALAGGALLAAWGAYVIVRDAQDDMLTPKDVRELVEEMEHVLAKWTTMRATERQRRKRERDAEQPEAEAAVDAATPGDPKAELWRRVHQMGLLRGGRTS